MSKCISILHKYDSVPVAVYVFFSLLSFQFYISTIQLEVLTDPKRAEGISILHKYDSVKALFCTYGFRSWISILHKYDSVIIQKGDTAKYEDFNST